MSKELPFFKFHSNEWLTGDIVFEPYDIQGVFIHVCSTYWSQDCSIDIARLKKRLSNVKEEQWQCLIDNGYIKVNSKGDVSISYLDEQINELGEQHKKKVEAGRKGGLASSKQRLSSAKPKVKHIDIEVDKEQEQEQEQESVFDLFNRFWNLYGKKLDTVKCQREWSNIDKSEYSKIIDHVPKFVKASGQYLCKPINYLEGRKWKDEQLPNYADTKKPQEQKLVPYKPQPPKH